MPKQSPPTTMRYSGIDFRVIDRHGADAILRPLTDFSDEKIYDVLDRNWRFSDGGENGVFLLAEGDVEVDTLVLEHSTDEHPCTCILGFIFKRDLTARQLISACDINHSPALVVLGKTTSPNIILCGNVHYLGGGLQCGTITGEYNDGELFVKGDVTAWLIHSDDMRMHFERFVAVQAAISPGRPNISICSRLVDQNGTPVLIENYLPSTHRLCDIVKDDALEQCEGACAGEQRKLAEDYYENFFETGRSLIDDAKTPLFTYANFHDDLIGMMETLSELDEVEMNGRIYREYGATGYALVNFTHEGTAYSEMLQTIGNGFNIRMRALCNPDTGELGLMLEYLDDKGHPKYRWQADETASGIEFLCVRCAMRNAFEVLNASATVDYDASDEASLMEFLQVFGRHAVPDALKRLHEFQRQHGAEAYAESFRLLPGSKTGLMTWSQDQRFLDAFIEFASANGSGSMYTYWVIDDDLNRCPIVVFGDEGGIHVVAENTRKLMQLLTCDTEISVDHENVYFHRDEDDYEESEFKQAYLRFANEVIPELRPIESDEETEAIIRQAKEKYQRRLNDFLKSFGIETFA